MSEPDVERERTLAELPLHDRLLHGIGRVAQAQARVEVALRMLYVQLTLPSPAAGYLVASRRTIGPLREDCEVLLAHSELPSAVKEAGAGALSDARSADDARNRVVHDLWLRDVDAPSELYQRLRTAKGTIGFKAEPSDLAYVDQAEAALRRAEIRLQALSMLATRLMFFPAGAEALGALLEDLLAEIRGEFDLLPDGGHRVRGASGAP